MNRPKFSQAKVIKALQETRGLVTLAAKRLNCEPSTIHNYIKRYPEVAEALKQQRETVTDIAELSLFKAIQEGQPWATCFYLKTQGRDRGYVERHDINLQITVPDIPVETLSDDKVNECIEQLEQQLVSTK